MRIAIIQFPGSNSEQESIRAISDAGMDPVPFLWNQDPSILERCDGFFIIGGFSYEDRSRAGIIAALDPIMPYIKVQAQRGKPVLGICNGAQVLVETGMVPGATGYPVAMSLTENKRISGGNIVGTGFYNSWIHMRCTVAPNASAFTRSLKPSEHLRVPVAHAEGRFITPDDLLRTMIVQQMTPFRYCDENGNIMPDFPINPNGSVFNLAAVTNASGNVMAMMPHPERTKEGQPIFTSMRDYIADETRFELKTLTYETNTEQIASKKLGQNAVTTNLIITDNEAKTVQSALQARGVNATVEKFDHWVFNEDLSETSKEMLHSSGELYNTNKQYVVKSLECDQNAVCVLVSDKEDFVGESKKRILRDNFNTHDLNELRKSTLWKITPTQDDHAIHDKILTSNILFNPYSQQAHMISLHDDYKETIRGQITNCIKETDLHIGEKQKGKVRDRYILPDKVILVTTDRQSAFDRILAEIPFKGQVLNQTSAWWFEKTKHIIENHVIDTPDPNVTVGKKCEVFPVEFVVRGYITGTTNTSAWTNYEKGVRNFCGNILPDGLKKNQKLPENIVTPTTKFEEHDRNLSRDEIIRENLMSKEDYDYCKDKALEIFAFAQDVASRHGFILADTKFEFGTDKDGNTLLIDEILTPDSSRYWLKSSYQERFLRGEEPENIDKEFLRLWFKNNCDPYNDETLPPAPQDLVVELSRRYIQLYEMITGQKFAFPDTTPIDQRIHGNLKLHMSTPAPSKCETPADKPEEQKVCAKEKIKAVLILGSVKDEPHAKKITDALDALNINWEQHVASAHKQAKRGIELIEMYKDSRVVYITIAGRSNALSGFVAGNSDKPTIACPPFSDKTDMLVNIHSTIQMPSKVPVMTILEPSNVALAICRMKRL